MLRFDHTLRWIPEDEEDPDGPGAWFIDLTSKSNRHKTRSADINVDTFGLLAFLPYDPHVIYSSPVAVFTDLR